MKNLFHLSFILLLSTNQISLILSFTSPIVPYTRRQSTVICSAKKKEMTRKQYIQSLCIAALVAAPVAGAAGFNRPAFAFTAGNSQVASTASSTTASTVAYKELNIKVPAFDVDVPVAMWFKPDEDEELVASEAGKNVVYSHRISVKRIGSLLAGLDFIPEFAAKDFNLGPTTSAATVSGESMSFP